MSAALAIWSSRVEPGKKTKLVAVSDIRITGAALDAKLADEKARSSVKLTYMTPQAASEGDEDEEAEPLPPTTSTVLCSLTPGQIEQSSLDLIINEDDVIEFEVIGKNTIYLSGNYITQPTDFPADDSDFESDEEAYDLRDVSSDVEIDPSEINALEEDSEQDNSHRFEEIKSEDEKKVKKESAPDSKKRPRESDAGEVTTDGEQKLSKKQQKKLNKKLKAEDGKAVANGDVKLEVKQEDEKKEVKQEGEMKAETKEKKAEKKGEKSSKKQAETKETSSGLKVKDVKPGSGKAAKKGDLVSMRYVGKFIDGKVFDSNTKGKPFTFKLGNGEVIKGWDEGIVGMQAGGERLLVVPPNLGYGSRKHDGIPANSTLRFECKLLEIKS